ncbi:hypothetical protein [Paeniglutamicibacter sp. NPDC091659]|uniref:hypothetical protein n=1 Tax=Paeniglutamicibacter sp. NPDC091659 TaxID=3364389 RepID=UPI003809C8F9
MNQITHKRLTVQRMEILESDSGMRAHFQFKDNQRLEGRIEMVAEKQQVLWIVNGSGQRKMVDMHDVSSWRQQRK